MPLSQRRAEAGCMNNPPGNFPEDPDHKSEDQVSTDPPLENFWIVLGALGSFVPAAIFGWYSFASVGRSCTGTFCGFEGLDDGFVAFTVAYAVGSLVATIAAFVVSRSARDGQARVKSVLGGAAILPVGLVVLTIALQGFGA